MFIFYLFYYSHRFEPLSTARSSHGLFSQRIDVESVEYMSFVFRSPEDCRSFEYELSPAF